MRGEDRVKGRWEEQEEVRRGGGKERGKRIGESGRIRKKIKKENKQGKKGKREQENKNKTRKKIRSEEEERNRK